MRHAFRKPATEDSKSRILRAVLTVDAAGFLPSRGDIGMTRKLADDGLLRSCGTADAYPHILYCLTGRGRRVLER
jgi:hypothetical protein